MTGALSALMRGSAGRFLVAGSLAALVNWLARIALSEMMDFEAAVLIAYAVGMAFGFVVYRAWVFPASPLGVGTQIRRFLAVNLVGAVEVWLVAILLVRLVFPALGFSFFPEAVGHGIAIAVGAATSYAGHRFLTFAAAKPL